MKELTYYPKADDEVLGSARFYERRSQGLGWRFLRTIREAEARRVLDVERGVDGKLALGSSEHIAALPLGAEF